LDLRGNLIFAADFEVLDLALPEIVIEFVAGQWGGVMVARGWKPQV